MEERYMSLIFDRTERKNRVTRELCYDNVATQFQFLGDNTITIWNYSDNYVFFVDEIDCIHCEGWIQCKKYNLIQPDGRVA